MSLTWGTVYFGKRIEKYDTEHKYRFQGGMTERHFGLFVLFEYDIMKNMNLIHMYNAGWK